MSKLLKLKQWLTVPDAARRLTNIFDEEVTEADVLRLALDGNLRLSVNILNHASARCGKVVPIDEVEYKEVPGLNKTGTVRLYGGVVLKNTNGKKTSVVKLTEEMVCLEGVYDLPMIGGERLDVEQKYQMLTNGVEVTLVAIDGAFVEGKDGVVCQLQTSFDDNEFYAGSSAQLERLKQHIANNNIEAAEAEKLLNRHKEDWKVFLEQKKLCPESDNYYPAGGLPKDSTLVVRADALREFEELVAGSIATDNPHETTGRRKQQHEIILAIIAALNFAPLQIPDGGKSEIKSACLTRPRLFTSDSFDHAWKAGLSADLFRMANHEKFSPK